MDDPRFDTLARRLATRRVVVGTGAKLAYAAPLVAASSRLTATAAGAQDGCDCHGGAALGFRLLTGHHSQGVSMELCFSCLPAAGAQDGDTGPCRDDAVPTVVDASGQVLCRTASGESVDCRPAERPPCFGVSPI